MDDDRLQAYANRASTIHIGTITSGANVEVLQRLRDNDPKLTKLVVCGEVYRGRVVVGTGASGFEHYCPSDNEDLGWVGAFIGYNNDLRELIVVNPIPEANDSLSIFFRGVSRNRSIQEIRLVGIDLSRGVFLPIMEPFFEHNANLRGVKVDACEFGGEGDRNIASIVQCCQSLHGLHLGDNFDEEDEQPTSIIAALRTQSQLQYLRLTEMNLRSIECASLAALPCVSALEDLYLRANNIDDAGVEAMMGALRNGNRLEYLDLSHNPLITTRGLQSIADALQHPTTDLRVLNLLWNGVDDEGANILARALANNRKLWKLHLVAGDDDPDQATHMGTEASDNLITARGWQAFADVLCNTASIEATYQSNHTLEGFSQQENYTLPNLEADGGAAILSSLALSLEMNWRVAADAARRKIIEHHLSSDEGMGHFAGMDRAVLPRALAWVPDDELSLLYRVVRNLHSELLIVPSAKEAHAVRRSKRQKTNRR